MKSSEQIIDCVEFKNELHRKLFVKSGAKDFNEYIKYIKQRFLLPLFHSVLGSYTTPYIA